MRIHPVRTESQAPRQLGAPARRRTLLGTVTTTSRHGSVTIAPRNPCPVTPAGRPHTRVHIQVTRAPAPAPVAGLGSTQNQDTRELTNTGRPQAHTELLWRQPPEVSTRSRQGRLPPRLSRQHGCSLPSRPRGAQGPSGHRRCHQHHHRDTSPESKRFEIKTF